MADGGDLREDLKVPDGELGQQVCFRKASEIAEIMLTPLLFCLQLKSEFEGGREILCTVLKACGEECVIAIKNNTALEKTN